MTDRELLDLAAKAAGHTLVWGGPDKDMARLADTFDNWNPLTDDGDALRLAVKLGLTINTACSDEYDNCFAAATKYNDLGLDVASTREVYTDDPYAATRRAIVRAAAEIGKAMP